MAHLTNSKGLELFKLTHNGIVHTDSDVVIVSMKEIHKDTSVPITTFITEGIGWLIRVGDTASLKGMVEPVAGLATRTDFTPYRDR